MDFQFAKVTNSRLMGSMGLLINWKDNENYIYQYFLLDAEGLEIADYVSLKNPTKDEAYREEERLMGGLGADRLKISQEEALFLVNYYGNKTIRYEKELPGEVDEYIEIVRNYDVDGIVFDDYFYLTNYPLPEGESRDGAVANARRENINST